MQENRLFRLEYNSIYHVYFLDVLDLLKDHSQENLKSKMAFKQAIFLISKYRTKEKLNQQPVNFYISFEDQYFFIIANFQFPKFHMSFFEENGYLIDEIPVMGHELFDRLSVQSWSHMPFYNKRNGN